MPVPIITNPMKLRQKLSESASQSPTPSYFGARTAPCTWNQVQHSMYATDCRGWMECPSSYRNGQVEKLVRITAGHQLNTGQHFTPATLWCAHWCLTLWCASNSGQRVGGVGWRCCFRGKRLRLEEGQYTAIGKSLQPSSTHPLLVQYSLPL